MFFEFLKNNPFVRIIVPYLFGIILQGYWGFSLLGIVYLLTICTCLLCVLQVVTLSYQNRFWYGVILNFWLLLLGLFMMNIHTVKNVESNEKVRDEFYFARVLDIPRQKTKNYQVTMQLEARQEDRLWIEEEVQVLAYFEPDSLVASIKAGDELIFKGRMDSLQENLNPFGFDYAKYLSIKQIGQVVYIPKGSWQIIQTRQKGIRFQALNLRMHLVNLFKKAGLSNDELAVVSALTLGYKDNLDAKVRKAYSGAGAMHVLAVSGMHVGIIYLILSGFLWFIKKRTWMKTVLLILALWGYAFITGLSPSVTRATLMFTFMLAGNIIDRRLNIYNSLAASGFLLLLINPNWLFDVGFQLSYLAVISIVFFHPKIYRMFYVPNKWLDKLWSLTAVSIAAQLGTTPISIYYFHQFPVYFWLSNIVVVLGATGLIYGSILLLILSPIKSLFIGFGDIMSLITRGLNGFVNLINQLPFSLIEQIKLSQMELFLIYLVLITTTISILFRSKINLLVALSCLLILGMMRLEEDVSKSRNYSVCVYHHPYRSAIQMGHQHESWWIISGKPNDEKMNNFMADANRHWKTNKNTILNLEQLNDTLIREKEFFLKEGFFGIGPLKGLILNSNSKLPVKHLNPVELNYLIVTGNVPFEQSDLGMGIAYQKLVIDGSVPSWKLNKWQQTGDNKSGMWFYTKENGAFIDFVSTK